MVPCQGVPVSLRHGTAAQLFDPETGDVVSPGRWQARVRLDDFPVIEMHPKFGWNPLDVAGRPWASIPPGEKLAHYHTTFVARVDGEVVEMGVRTESVRKRLGIGSNTKGTVALWAVGGLVLGAGLGALMGLSVGHIVLVVIVVGILGLIFGALIGKLKAALDNQEKVEGAFGEVIDDMERAQNKGATEAEKRALAKDAVRRRLGPQFHAFEAKKRKETLGGRRLSAKEAKQIQQYARVHWSELCDLLDERKEALPSGSTEKPLIYLSKEDNPIPFPLIFCEDPKHPGERTLYVQLPDAPRVIGGKSLYQVRNFYRPSERLILATQSGPPARAERERLVRERAGDVAGVCQPIAGDVLPDGVIELFSLNGEYGKLKRRPLLTQRGFGEFEDLAGAMAGLHRRDVHLAAIRPFPIGLRTALLDLSLATTPGIRAEDPTYERMALQEPWKLAPEVRRECQAHRSSLYSGRAPHKPSNPFSPASDVWELGTRLCLKLLALPVLREGDQGYIIKEHVRAVLRKEEYEEITEMEIMNSLYGHPLPGALFARRQARNTLDYLVFRMLRIDPRDRITAQECVKHFYRWVVLEDIKSMERDPEAHVPAYLGQMRTCFERDNPIIRGHVSASEIVKGLADYRDVAFGQAHRAKKTRFYPDLYRSLNLIETILTIQCAQNGEPVPSRPAIEE